MGGECVVKKEEKKEKKVGKMSRPTIIYGDKKN